MCCVVEQCYDESSLQPTKSRKYRGLSIDTSRTRDETPSTLSRLTYLDFQSHNVHVVGMLSTSQEMGVKQWTTKAPYNFQPTKSRKYRGLSIDTSRTRDETPSKLSRLTHLDFQTHNVHVVGMFLTSQEMGVEQCYDESSLQFSTNKTKKIPRTVNWYKSNTWWDSVNTPQTHSPRFPNTCARRWNVFDFPGNGSQTMLQLFTRKGGNKSLAIDQYLRYLLCQSAGENTSECFFSLRILSSKIHVNLRRHLTNFRSYIFDHI